MSRRRRPSVQSLKLFASLLGQPQEWRHGYALSKDSGLKGGTLYPLLLRLSGRGLLESRWEVPARAGLPPRHSYRLTGPGAVFARSQLRQATGGGAGQPV